MDKTPQAGRSNEEIVEGRNFFCDSETIEIIYSMMDEARRDTAEEKDKEIERLKALLLRCKKYITELQSDNFHEPNVGIFYDSELGNLFGELNNL